ncbi:MAG: ABC transporter permease [Kofleriaceae bacterium]
MKRTTIIVGAGVALVLVLLVVLQPALVASMFALGFAAQVVVIAVPYALAALGGSVTERAGVVDLALESKLLFGAFAAAAVGHLTDSGTAGIVAGVGAGMLVAAIQILCALRLGADQVIVGVALNLLALGGTRFLLQLLFDEGANSPPCPAYGDAIIGNPLVWIAVLASIAVPIALSRTVWGLRTRAAGDRPEALVAVGVDPARTRLLAALVGGGLAGAGGAQLSLAIGGFVADMSSGRGYIAIAMVILAGWRPGWAALACLGVGAAEAINIQLQITGSSVPRELAPLLPYVMTLVVLVIAGGSRRPPPASLGESGPIAS